MSNANSFDEYSFLKIGDTIPDFTWKNETGQEFSSGILQGKYTLIILFAADCRHCRDNFAYLEKNLFSKCLSSLNILAFGRDCDPEQIEAYQMKYPLSIKLTPDPNKGIYSMFAEKAVPRTYLFDSEGKLLGDIRGFRADEIDELIKIVS